MAFALRVGANCLAFVPHGTLVGCVFWEDPPVSTLLVVQRRRLSLIKVPFDALIKELMERQHSASLFFFSATVFFFLFYF